MKTSHPIKFLPNFPSIRKDLIADIIVYLFIMLFMYTVASKVQSFGAFQFVLKQSPVFGHYNVLISWLILSSQVAITVFLLFDKTRFAGLGLSVLLLLIFTVYLIYMVSSGTVLMCSCGGVVDKMGWKQHIWFNIAFILLGIIGMFLIRPYWKKHTYKSIEHINSCFL